MREGGRKGQDYQKGKGSVGEERGKKAIKWREGYYKGGTMSKYTRKGRLVWEREEGRGP